ncbi:MAG: GntR family transcriptional regulator [Anaerolineales bacterium]|nr:GntR family transcriptional regulator [Anaerolineales bacterium]
MESSHLYRQIVEAIRDDILSGAIKPGSSLPPMRKMTKQWNCTTGTIMRAYQELAHQGLVVSHVGKGTNVVEYIPEQGQTPMRRAALFNRMEAFLLEIMTAGYSPDEVELSLRVALDRWRTFSAQPEETPPDVLRFVGSHDPSLALIASQYHENNPELSLHLSFTGSLGGLIALAEKKADLAGCHLWDENTDTYNEPFIRKLLPGQKVAMLTLAHRRVGLIVPAGNPLGIDSLKSLTKAGAHFVNRQQGSGTRVWLDAQLRSLKINSSGILGYDEEKMTHSEVARTISKGQANVGVGVETAALSFGLDFKPLTTERYDLIIPFENWGDKSIQILKRSLGTKQTKSVINNLGGYDTTQTGTVTWVT